MQKRWSPVYCGHHWCVPGNIQTKSPSCPACNRRFDRAEHADTLEGGEQPRVSIGLPDCLEVSPDVEPTRRLGRALARNVRWSPSRPHRPFADEIADYLQKEGSRPAPTNLDRPDRLVDIEPHWPDRHQLLRCIRLSVQHRDARF